MTPDSFSQFYFIDPITSSNRFLNFLEPNGSNTELTAELQVGSFTVTQLQTIIKTALDGATGSVNTYTVSFNRTTRKFTISADDTFELLLSSGSQIGTSPFSLLGFTQASDLTASTSYTGADAAGSLFIPQFRLQDFVASSDFQEKIDSSINESASGRLEVVNFGTRKFVEFSLKFITDVTPQDGKVIRNNPNGVSDARSFMQFVTTKSPYEFMVDKDNPSSFETLILESTGSSRDGTGYRLRELVDQGLKGYFEVNRLRSRVV